MKKFNIFLTVTAVFLFIFIGIFWLILAKNKVERQKQVQVATKELISVMAQFKAEGYQTCNNFYDDGKNLPSAQYNYYKNGVMRNYNGKFYWLRCNFTSKRPVIISLKNRNWPDQYVPPLIDWGYIYDDSVAQKLYQ